MSEIETVEELAADSTGRWLVTTQGTQHIWDLDKMTYARFPSSRSLRGACLADAEDLLIVRVDRYPKIGDTSIVLCSNPSFPEIHHWRQSSLIDRIERLHGMIADDDTE